MTRLLAHIVFDDYAVPRTTGWGSRDPEEIRADNFARNLLVPTEALDHQVAHLAPGRTPDLRTLSALVQHFQASPQIVAIQLASLGLIADDLKKEWLASATAPSLASKNGDEEYRFWFATEVDPARRAVGSKRHLGSLVPPVDARTLVWVGLRIRVVVTTTAPTGPPCVVDPSNSYEFPVDYLCGFAYDVHMSLDVVPTSEARTALPSTLNRFRKEGLLAEPMIFGGHRKAEGVVMPYALFERLLPAIEDVALAEVVRARLAKGEESVDFDQFAAQNGFDVDAYLSTKAR